MTLSYFSAGSELLYHLRDSSRTSLFLFCLVYPHLILALVSERKLAPSRVRSRLSSVLRAHRLEVLLFFPLRRVP